MDPLTALALLDTALILVLLGLRLRPDPERTRLQEAMVRIETRLDEQFRRWEALSAQLEHRARSAQEAIGALDARLREEQAQTQQSLERRLGELGVQQANSLAQSRSLMSETFGELREHMASGLAEHRTRFEQRQVAAMKVLNHTLQSGMRGVHQQVQDALARHAQDLGRSVDALTRTTEGRLNDISTRVQERLNEGFEKTTATFADVLKRLALIDEAQKRIAELSSNVVSLQEVLADKRSRGAFGEVQLNALVRNVLPPRSFALQHTLPNGYRVDCMLFLPEPSGRIAIDAKFPLESYRRMNDESAGAAERREAARAFKQDIRRHVQDIAEKYIVPGLTSDGAVMFIPAEAVFAEIQAHHPDLVQAAHAARVWMCSPTTLMAVLNTARAVLKDDATRRQVHIIQEHLGGLAEDFQRFRKRMDNLARHIGQANRDVSEVNVSAGKISERFQRIEQVELGAPEDTQGALPEEGAGASVESARGTPN